MRSKRLTRQLKKAFGDDTPEESLKTLLDAPESDAARERLQAIATAFPEFLDGVQKSFDEFEEKVSIAQRSVEISNQELTDVNQNLFSLNKTFQAMVNSLDQGFFLFGEDGICLPVYTKACERLVETMPAGKNAAEVLGVPEEKREYFGRWCELLFREVIEFKDIAAAGPQTFTHSKNLTISIEYKPVRDFDGKIEYVVAILTDRTSEVRAKTEANEMHAFAVLVSSIIRDREQFRRFVEASRQIIETAWTLVDQSMLSGDDLTIVKRQIHTLKGASGSFGMLSVKVATHKLETLIADESDRRIIHAILLKALPEIRATFESILVLHADVIGDALKARAPIREVPLPVLLDFDATLANLGRAAEPARVKFRSEVLGVPMKKAFGHFSGILNDAANQLGKKIAPLWIKGDNLRIQPEIFENLTASLVHIFRNIADHGIEAPAERSAKGKLVEGQVTMNFTSVDINGRSHLKIEIADDGAGINVARLRAKYANTLQDANDVEVMQKIFDSGISTTERVSEFSGRGEGLGAVMDEVKKLGGTIEVGSTPNMGTTFTLILPCEFATFSEIPDSSGELHVA